MITAIRTSLLCDAVPIPDTAPARRRNPPALPNSPAEPRPGAAALQVTATPGVQLGTFTVVGSHVTTAMRDGQATVSFYLNCNPAQRVHYPLAAVVQTRTIGACGGHGLVELTIAYWRAGR